MRLLIVSATALLVLTVAGSVLACDCRTVTPNESFQRADVVFEGWVIRSVPSSSGTDHTFRVQKLLK